jgi:hypothetical protein
MVQGALDDQWPEHFNTQAISVSASERGEPMIVLVSEPIDRDALVGLINRLNGLSINLVSISMWRKTE